MVKKIAEKFKRLSRVHQRHRQTDNRHTTNGRPIAYSERNVVRSLKIDHEWAAEGLLQMILLQSTEDKWAINESSLQDATYICNLQHDNCDHCVYAYTYNFTQFAPETTKFRKITLNKSHFAVQGHSRSPILVPIESPYTIFY